jgi:hypothetical protein
LTFPTQSFVRTAPGVVVKSWGEDLALAYATSQGKTHLISAAGAAILEAACVGDTSVQSLLNLYQVDTSIAESQDTEVSGIERHLHLTLEGLSQAGLLRVSE